MTTTDTDPGAKIATKLTMVITLRGGAQLRIPVESFTTKRSPIDNKLCGLDWTAETGATTKLQMVDLDEVAAIHSEREATP